MSVAMGVVCYQRDDGGDHSTRFGNCDLPKQKSRGRFQQDRMARGLLPLPGFTTVFIPKPECYASEALNSLCRRWQQAVLPGCGKEFNPLLR